MLAMLSESSVFPEVTMYWFVCFVKSNIVFLVALSGVLLSGCSMIRQTHRGSMCSVVHGRRTCHGPLTSHKNYYGFGMNLPYRKKARSPSSTKVIVNNGYSDRRHHHRHYSHHHKEGHGSKTYGCISGPFYNKACGYGCMKDQHDLNKIFCGKEPGDNCVSDRMGYVKCGKNCVATSMSTIICNVERYSRSSSRP